MQLAFLVVAVQYTLHLVCKTMVFSMIYSNILWVETCWVLQNSSPSSPQLINILRYHHHIPISDLRLLPLNQYLVLLLSKLYKHGCTIHLSEFKASTNSVHGPNFTVQFKILKVSLCQFILHIKGKSMGNRQIGNLYCF